MALHNSGIGVWIHIITRLSWACGLNGITQRGRLVYGYIYSLALTGSWLYVSIHQSPSLCNAIQITGQMPSRFYIIPYDVNLSANISVYNSFITSYQFDWLLLALYDDGCSGVLNHVLAQRLHVLPSSLFAMSTKCVSDVMVK